MLYYTDWEKEGSVRRIRDCGKRRKFCKRMGLVKRRKGVRSEEMVWRSDFGGAGGWMKKGGNCWRWKKKFLCRVELVYIYDTSGWHRNNKDRKTLFTEHSQITRISAYPSLLRNLGKTNGVNNPGKSGGHEMLLVGLVKLFHCSYSFRGCAQASGMSLIHLREGERRNRKE